MKFLKCADCLNENNGLVRTRGLRTLLRVQESSSAPSFLLVFPGVLGQVPGLAVGADIRAKLFWRSIGGNLMRGCGQGFALGVVLALARYRAF